VEYATFLAWRVGATIELLHVWDLESVPGNEEHRALVAEWSAKRTSLNLLARTHSKTGVDIRGRLEFGTVAAAIGRVATTGRFDLIVMGSPGKSANSMSTTFAVKNAVRCPVIHMRSVFDPELGVRRFSNPAALLPDGGEDALSVA
jgi:hypothetical protein